MTIHEIRGTWLAAAALIALPTAAIAQDNVAGAATANTTVTTTTTETNTAVAEPMTTTTPDMNAMAADPMAGNMVADDPLLSDVNSVNTTEPEYAEVQREEDNDFPWGLLGLLGLAGLLGRKKRDAGDVHVDARHDTRP